jgi:Cu2+-exporting ATPase
VNGQVCFHCGAPLNELQQIVQVNGQMQSVCGESCRDIAAKIDADGLAEFYRYRDGPTESVIAEERDAGRWLGFDRPALQAEFVVEDENGSRRAMLLLQGVRCAACSWLIENSLGALPGVIGVVVDPLTTRGEVHWDPKRIALSAILLELARLGYTPYPYTEDETDRLAVIERRAALKRLIVAGLGMMQVMSFAVALYAGAFQAMEADIETFLRLISLLVATPVVFYSGAPFFAGAIRGVRTGSMGMDVPVALAIGGAYAASVWNTLTGEGSVYFDSATMFVFFLSSARFLEMAARHKALSLTGALAQHLPRIATRLSHGQPEQVGAMELVRGDQVLVTPGGVYPVDGVLESEHARLDESLLTGESAEVNKRRGDPVVAGSINGNRAAIVRVEQTGAATTMAQISRMVTGAQQEKPRLVQAADRIASWFIVGVLAIAVIVGLAWGVAAPERAFEVVLSVLVVTCPCALALATPAAFTVATSALARRGFMIRRPGALQALSRVSAVLFDKTGTLTANDSVIHRIDPLGDVPLDEIKSVACALEAQSEHPLAKAFPLPDGSREVTDVRAVPASGVEGCIDGRSWRIGTINFVAALSGADYGGLADIEATMRTVYLGNSAGIVARFTISEKLRDGVCEMLGRLSKLRISASIASGDLPGPVAALAKSIGITDYCAQMTPAGKLALMRRRRNEGAVIVAVGDGINDSPVLAGADVSVAMGTGSALAQHSADCVLMSPGLEVLGDAIETARRTMTVVRQNLIWAVAYNLIALPMAATGLLAPWMAAVGMSASSLIVTMNAMRLGAASPRRDPVANTGQKTCCREPAEPVT